MRSSQIIMIKRLGNPKLDPRLHNFFMCLLACLCFLSVFPASVHSSSLPVHEGVVASGSQAVRGSSSLGTRPISERSGMSTPLVSLLVSATSSSSASVPTALAASSSTLGLLADTTDQELDNETINNQPVTNVQSSIPTADDAGGVQNKGEVLPDSVPKSGSDRINTNKREFRCENSTGKCSLPSRNSSLDKDLKNNKTAAAVKQVSKVESSTSDHHIATSSQPPSTTSEKLMSSTMVQSTTTTITTTTGTTAIIESATTTPQTTQTTTTERPPSTKTVTTSTTTTMAVPKTTVTKGTTTTPTVPVPSSSSTIRDYPYNNQAELSDYTEYSDARFAEERRRDQNASFSVYGGNSQDTGDDLDLYDMERDINPTEGAAFERTRPNRNMTTGMGKFGSPNKDSLLRGNLTGKYNLTNKQIFFPEHFPLRKMKHRTWFAQQHRLGRHELDPIDDGPFSSLIWKDKKYLISVLVPIGVGIAGAVVFVVAAYATRSCRGAPQTFIPTVGTDLFLQHVHSRNDDIFLLMETTDDEM